MSSDHFLHFQKILRDVKDVHNIDLTSPNGVIIGDRKYPAIHKDVYSSRYEDAPHMLDYDAGFSIPFENGTQLSVSVSNGHVASMASQLHVPTIHLNGDGTKIYTHGPALHIGEDSFHNDHKESYLTETRGVADIHDIINKYSKLPHQGTYDWVGNREGSDAFKKVRPNAYPGAFNMIDGEDLALNPEELQEHNNNYRFNPERGPLHIRVSSSDSSSGVGHSLIMHHRYNTQTEQMQQFDWQ